MAANDGKIQILSEGLYKGTLVIFTMKMETVAHDELSVAERSYQSSCEVGLEESELSENQLEQGKGQQGDNLSLDDEHPGPAHLLEPTEPKHSLSS